MVNGQQMHNQFKRDDTLPDTLQVNSPLNNDESMSPPLMKTSLCDESCSPIIQEKIN